MFNISLAIRLQENLHRTATVASIYHKIPVSNTQSNADNASYECLLYEAVVERAVDDGRRAGRADELIDELVKEGPSRRTRGYFPATGPPVVSRTIPQEMRCSSFFSLRQCSIKFTKILPNSISPTHAYYKCYISDFLVMSSK